MPQEIRAKSFCLGQASRPNRAANGHIQTSPSTEIKQPCASPIIFGYACPGINTYANTYSEEKYCFPSSLPKMVLMEAHNPIYRDVQPDADDQVESQKIALPCMGS